jgi:heme A synthase
MRPTAIIGLVMVLMLILLSEYLRLAPDPQEVMSWARPMHRLIASTTGLLVLGLVGFSLLRKKNRAVCLILLGLTVFLAWLGIYSADSHDPAIVMGNQGGGFAMLGGFAWLIFKKPKAH